MAIEKSSRRRRAKIKSRRRTLAPVVFCSSYPIGYSMRFFAVPLTAILLSSTAHASNALEQLHQFLEGSKTAKASYTQSVIYKNGKDGQKASGSMVFQRPRQVSPEL